MRWDRKDKRLGLHPQLLSFSEMCSVSLHSSHLFPDGRHHAKCRVCPHTVIPAEGGRVRKMTRAGGQPGLHHEFQKWSSGHLTPVWKHFWFHVHALLTQPPEASFSTKCSHPLLPGTPLLLIAAAGKATKETASVHQHCYWMFSLPSHLVPPSTTPV